VTNAPRQIRWLDFLAAFRAWLFLGILLITFEIWAHIEYGSTFFLNPFNVKSITVFTVTPLLLGLGQTFVIISGGIDLSVGFTMGLSAVVTAHVFNWGTQFGNPILSLVLAVFAGLGIAVVPGVINGLLIADLRVPPFIGTLGMYGVARGVAFLLARGTTVPVQNGLLGAIGNGEIAGFPNLVLITIAILLMTHYLLSQTRYGQHIYAIGGNEQAARVSGINASRYKMLIYVYASFLAGLAGLVVSSRIGSGQPGLGVGYELDAIAAAVIGGTSLSAGGIGTVAGTIVGALIIGVLNNTLDLMNVSAYWQQIIKGCIIVGAVIIDQLKHHGSK